MLIHTPVSNASLSMIMHFADFDEVVIHGDRRKVGTRITIRKDKRHYVSSNPLTSERQGMDGYIRGQTSLHQHAIKKNGIKYK